MLGGAGKYLGLLMASILVPFYACLILGVIFFAHIWVFLVAALLLMPMCVMAVQTYKHSIFAGCRALGLVTQKPGKKEEFDYIPFEGYIDMGTAKDNSAEWHRYSLRDRLSGRRTILTMKDELERLAYEADEIFVGSWIETLPTANITGVMIGRYAKHISIFDREELGFWAKYVRRQKPTTMEEIPMVQVYASSETGQSIFEGRYKGVPDPHSKEFLEQLKTDFEFIDDAKVRTELGTTKDALESAEEMLKVKGGCEIRFRAPKPKQEGMTTREVLTIAGVIIAAVVGMVIIFKLMGAF